MKGIAVAIKKRSKTSMTIKQLLNKGMIMLKSNQIDSPKIKARLLLQYILDNKGT